MNERARRILTVVGARPQFVKASVVSLALRSSDVLEETIVHTGQHFDDDMSNVFFRQLDLPSPSIDLAISGGHHGEMTGRMLMALEEVMLAERPDMVLLYGDTNSTLAGALAAAKLCIPIAHVEAGLRSFNRAMPEEINRVLTDELSRLLFAPTENAAAHLLREGKSPDAIKVVGDVMYDAVRVFGEHARYDYDATGIPDSGFVLVTVHRAENTDSRSRLRIIVDAVIEVSESVPVVWPLHPRTRARLAGDAYERLTAAPRVHMIGPANYLEMLALERDCSLVMTDSGGVQKEAFFASKPCVTVREETEWVELLDAGWNTLSPPVSAAEMARAVRTGLGSRGTAVSPYGDGHAAAKIVRMLECSW